MKQQLQNIIIISTKFSKYFLKFKICESLWHTLSQDNEKQFLNTQPQNFKLFSKSYIFIIFQLNHKKIAISKRQMVGSRIQIHSKSQSLLHLQIVHPKTEFVIEQFKKQNFFTSQNKYRPLFKNNMNKNTKLLSDNKRMSVFAYQNAQRLSRNVFKSIEKPRKSYYEAINKQKIHSQYAKHPSQKLNKVPKFIKQRQQKRKSFNNAYEKSHLTQLQNFGKRNNLEQILITGLNEIQLTQSFTNKQNFIFDSIKPYNPNKNYESEKWHKKNLTIIGSCQIENKKLKSFQSSQTQSTNESLQRCLSGKICFTFVLSYQQQKQINEDLDKIFQSQINSNGMFEQRQNLQLSKQFMAILN